MRTPQSIIVKVKSDSLVFLGPNNSPFPATANAGLRDKFLSRAAGLGVTQARPLSSGRTAGASWIHPGVATFAVGVPTGQSADDLSAVFSRQPWVEYAEVDGLLELHDAPDDPLWPRQWDLENTGQPYWSVRGFAGEENDSLIERTGSVGADIRFLSAYESSDPTAEVLVGVIDTGIDTAHVDLQDRLARNTGEIPNNAIDDDNNGLVDDVLGWDFSGDELLPPLEIVGDNDITDDVGHGTHVAGTIAAAVNNSMGIAGVCANARVIGARIFPNPFFSVSAQAIYYTVDRGARVINMSWGGSFRSRAIEDALQYAHDRGVVLVCSMGNSGRDEIFYPSGYTTTIGVGSSTATDRLSSFSTYNDFVDIVAPGQDILSLRAAGTDLYADVGEPNVHVIDEHYLIASGTSMSSPHAAGAAAVLLSFAPGLSNERVREILRASADDIVFPYGPDSLNLPGLDRYTGAGRINLERAMSMLPGILVDVTNHPRGVQLSEADTVITGRIEGRNAAEITAQLSPLHPPDAIDWTSLGPDRVQIDNGSFQIRLPEAATLSGPYTLRIDAGVDAVLDWPFWFGSTTIAEINSPVPTDTIQLLRPIVGTAYAPDFTSYMLTAVGPLPSLEQHPIASSSVYRWNDTLAYWRTDALAGGAYNLILSVGTASGTNADTVQVLVRDAFLSGFPVDLPSPAHFSVATVNLDGADGEEIICPTSSGLYVLQSNGGIYPGWPRATSFDVSTAPAVADLDRDGKFEIIVASNSYMHVYAFIGEAFAGWPQLFLGGSGVFGNSLPVIGDVDGTGGLEVAGIDRHGRIKIWHSDGAVFAPKGGEYYARIGIDNTLGNALPRMAIVDLDHDGRTEVIAAGDDIHIYNAITADAYGDNDTTLVSSHYSTHGIVVTDLDGDAEYEIAYVATEGPTDFFKLHVIDVSGDEREGWPRQIPLRVNLYLQYSLSAGDIDGDQIPELFFAPYSLGEGHLYAFHGNGAPVGSDSSNGLLASLPGTVSTIAIANIDHDDAPEIVMRVGDFISGPDHIYALKADGQLAPGYPIMFGDGNSITMPSPLIGDLNADGMADMTTVQSTSSSVAVWELGVPATSRGQLWPKFGGDLWNSNIAVTPRYDIVYLVRLIDMVFHGGLPLAPYEPSDVDCDGVTTINDIVVLKDYLFRNGARPCNP
jgi:subtilisin family serine protease